ncbi:unnamed protein product [Schistosoma guineensis]|nr:unnamed protein product [Schistosoma guineensis]
MPGKRNKVNENLALGHGEMQSDAPPDIRQVKLDAFSCHGSNVSLVSRRSKVSSRITLAELKERQLSEMRDLKDRQTKQLLRFQREFGSLRLNESVCSKLSSVSNCDDREKEHGHRFVSPHNLRTKSLEKSKLLDYPETKRKEVTLESLSVGLELPKVELSTFEGQPAKYWKFIRQFDLYVVSKVEDDGQRLLYLLHYCKGKAREAIEECIMLPPSSGYRRARDILKRLFGRTHEICRALMKDLTEGPDIAHNDAESLSRLAIKMENCSITLEQMDYSADLNSVVTIESIVKKLPTVLQMRWAETVGKVTANGREPTFAELTEFVSSRAEILLSRFGQIATASKRAASKVACSTQSLSFGKIVSKSPCVMCGETHSVDKCFQFSTLAVNDKWAKAKEKGLCYCCLRRGHRSVDCKDRVVCTVEGCRDRHHPSLHKTIRVQSGSSECLKESHCGYTESLKEDVFLGLIPVRLRAGDKEVSGYAFLDNGSDTTLIKLSTVRRLGLSSDGASITIKTVNGNKLSRSTTKAFKAYSLNGDECICIEQAVVVDDLPVHRPRVPVKDSAKKWPHLIDLPWTESVDGEVMLLIGCDVPEAHWVLDQRLGGRKSPYAIRTLLGWVLFGPAGFSKNSKRMVNYISQSDNPVEQLKEIYNYEFADVHSSDKALSLNDLKAVSIVERDTYFDEGHWIVPLPWRVERNVVSGSYDLARRRLESLRRRLTCNKDFRESYTCAMQQTIDQGYAVVVPGMQLDPGYRPKWYLPHHAVINPRKPSRVRVVLDCAAKVAGKSLNDLLYQGPDTTACLVGILLRFRREPVAVSADVEEMFMQVKVSKPDCGALRFLWWPKGDIEKEPVEYQMTSHPFGAISSPFCANFALMKTAQKFSSDYDSSVGESVLNNFYVDDCLVSFPNDEDAKSFVVQLNELMARGGFKLKKWVTNSEITRKVFPHSDSMEAIVDMSLNQGPTHRALGIEWDTTHDVFNFRFDPGEKTPTRRGILSTISSLFDPLGLIAPIYLPAKQLLQNLCKTRIGWDQPPSDSVVSSWNEWVTFVRRLGTISVPRSIINGNRKNFKAIELHLFCDASESGYGAVAYSWNIPKHQAPYSVLLYSKSRVAPIKQVTVPRLELAAAVLSARMGEVLNRNLPQVFDKTHFWTDSMIVLYYIKNTDSRYSTFVANRLAAIHHLTSVDQWGHVESNENPADWTSRGIRKELDLKNRIEGPSFLRKRESVGTLTLMCENPPENVEFKRCHTTNVVAKKHSLSPVLLYHSNWIKLIKAVAWLRRYVTYITIMYSRHNDRSLSVGYLSVDELDAAKHKVLALVQKEVYGEAVKVSRCNGVSATDIKELKNLSPTLIDGLLCVGGRLNYSDYPLSIRHPVILPSHHFVTELIIRHHHHLEGHTGTSQVLATIRRNYWIVKGTSAVKRVIGRCVRCIRAKATLGQQMMAPLPKCRVQQGWFCFSSVGIDYFGPLIVRRGRSVEKRYGCLFTCLQTRAVHLEVAFNLSTDAFIMALMRFIGRRGTPKEIYSDNGTNFVGATSELRANMSVWDKHKINDLTVSKGIRWHFNPPLASHRGGVWERLIRSVRRILLSISNGQILHDDSLATYFVEVERILNNRPIVPATSDEKDDLVLTPNTLLLLRDSDGANERCSKKRCAKALPSRGSRVIVDCSLGLWMYRRTVVSPVPPIDIEQLVRRAMTEMYSKVSLRSWRDFGGRCNGKRTVKIPLQLLC